MMVGMPGGRGIYLVPLQSTQTEATEYSKSLNMVSLLSPNSLVWHLRPPRIYPIQLPSSSGFLMECHLFFKFFTTLTFNMPYTLFLTGLSFLPSLLSSSIPPFLFSTLTWHRPGAAARDTILHFALLSSFNSFPPQMPSNALPFILTVSDVIRASPLKHFSLWYRGGASTYWRRQTHFFLPS